MICFVLEEQDCKKIDREVIKYGKRILRGDATAKEQQRDLTTKYRYKGDHYVFAAMGVAPIRLELVVARLRFLQRMARDPDKHEQWITVMYGTLECGKKGSACAQTRKNTSLDGTNDSGHGHDQTSGWPR